ncbi:uncharacterized protein IL334_007089 [Kwoniella shivajii]|uniref:Nicotinamide riboside kinase n=1 Tax=Kwoniella shivajii TaxID=564305 RepID=A0ABZ1D867_9TREE|nr:hypothetical protein IL334_007089 [Kwoniella shivajii]
MSSSARTRLVIIGIGGASCSGKTLLAKHIHRALPEGAHIIHQDDFCPPEETVPYSDRYPDLQDWDDPETCIMWPEFRSILREMRKTGQQASHASHDHLNKQVEVKIQQHVFDKWRKLLTQYVDEQKKDGVDIAWSIVDGFVLYWDKLFLRVPYQVLKQRREERQVYVLQQGGVWVDPPGYFDKIVWPGYLKAHNGIFDDVERGPVKKDWSGNLLLLQPGDGEDGMTAAFDEACGAILDGCKTGAGIIISS